eukprot:TRINITY_DN7867_c0_g1_i1.p1 TRINITY_DN7867_c0_g1~~TRINITY_DN7867_c0_g1_i1.p1  ORF type:complete len:385 (+),score=89.46 TRINITY_DN7867_c0_g1_i1:475-1629(+)
MGVYGRLQDDRRENLITFFSISAGVAAFGLLAFYLLIWSSLELLNKKPSTSDRKDMCKRIKAIKEAKARDSSPASSFSVKKTPKEDASCPLASQKKNSSCPLSTGESAPLCPLSAQETPSCPLSVQEDTSLQVTKSVGWADLEGEAGISNSTDIEAGSDCLIDDDFEENPALHFEQKKDDWPVLSSADAPITLDTSKLSMLTMSNGGNGVIIRRIWPCGLALLLINLSRLLLLNSLPQVPEQSKLVPSADLTQTLIYIQLGCDLAGRIITLIPLPSDWWAFPSLLLFIAMLQFLSLNLFFIYIFQPHHTPWIPYSDLATKIYMAIFSSITGFVLTQCYLVAPTAVSSTSLKPQVGALMNVFSQVGNVLGLIVGFTFAFTIYSQG